MFLASVTSSFLLTNIFPSIPSSADGRKYFSKFFYSLLAFFREQATKLDDFRTSNIHCPLATVTSSGLIDFSGKEAFRVFSLRYYVVLMQINFYYLVNVQVNFKEKNLNLTI